MQKKQEEKRSFGLLGRQISYSFSRGYFSDKFEKLNLVNCSYENFDLESIDDLTALLNERADLAGLNVTIPYKEAVIAFLDVLDPEAAEIGAVNTIKFLKNGDLKGYNTDCYGFEESLKPLLTTVPKKALILGTGGASKAIGYVLKKMDITTLFVSRNPREENQISYSEISSELLRDSKIIVNCTPLGTYPNTDDCPDINYTQLTKDHLLYDLIYNPEETLFLKKGKQHGAKTINGLRMLELQAEKAWDIWTAKK